MCTFIIHTVGNVKLLYIYLYMYLYSTYSVYIVVMPTLQCIHVHAYSHFCKVEGYGKQFVSVCIFIQSTDNCACMHTDSIGLNLTYTIMYIVHCTWLKANPIL